MPKASRGVGIGEVFPSQPTRGSGGASLAPPDESGAKFRPQTLFQHFLSVTERFRWKQNAILLISQSKGRKVSRYFLFVHFWIFCLLQLTVRYCRSLTGKISPHFSLATTRSRFRFGSTLHSLYQQNLSKTNFSFSHESNAPLNNDIERWVPTTHTEILKWSDLYGMVSIFIGLKPWLTVSMVQLETLA